MKLDEKVGETMLGGVKESGEMRIRASGKVFSALSSKVYSDKELAVIRELSCNALDSHIEAGKANIPFHVQLPNNFSSDLVIEDFGLGLSQSQVENIYSTYFDSSKSGSNDVIGAFGIGSKAGFSVSDSFQLTAIKDGIKLHYSIMLNENGIPTRNLLHKSKTSEGNGVKVVIPVKNTDTHKFTEAAKKVFKHFTVKPKITGQNIVFDDKKPDVDTSGYRLWNATDRYYPSRKLGAIMGNVYYPVDSKLLDLSTVAKFNLLPIEELILKFKIGDLEPALSREQLEYKSLTVNALNRELGLFIANHIKELESQLHKSKNTLHAIEFLNNNSGFLRNCKIKYKGKNVEDFDVSIDANAKATPPIPELKVKYYKLNYNGNLEEREQYRAFNVSNLLNTSFIFIHNDNPKKGGIKPRIKLYLESIGGRSSNKYVYLLEDAHIDKINKGLDNDYDKGIISELSALPAPPPKQKGVNNTINYWRLNSSSWERLTTKPTHGIFQPIEFARAIGTSEYHIDKAQELLKIEVFGTNVEETAKIVGNTKWVSLIDYIKKELDKSKDEIEFDYFANSLPAVNILEMFKYGEISKTDPDIIALYAIYERLTKNKARLKKAGSYEQAEVNKWASLVNICGGSSVVVSTKLEKEVDTLTKSIYNKFPLLGILTGKLSDKATISKELVEYVELKQV